jgi:hypothetical protein
MSSPVTTRSRTATGAATIAIVVLVLAFGNQAYTEWAAKHAQGATAWDLLLRTLAWPRWFATSGGNASRDVIAFDLRALLLILFVAALVGLAGGAVVGSSGGFMLGWFSVIVGAALAAMLTAFIATQASLFNALNSAAAASVYGLFVGWIIGIAAAMTSRSTAG